MLSSLAHCLRREIMAWGACNHKDPVSVFSGVCQCDWPPKMPQHHQRKPRSREGVFHVCRPTQKTHVQHVFLYKKDLNITQQLSLENMLNQTPLAHGVATTLPDAFRVRITRNTCCQNQTQRLSQVRVGCTSEPVFAPKLEHCTVLCKSWPTHTLVGLAKNRARSRARLFSF